MRFTFIHAADLHIDSPLESLGAKDPAVAERFARAGRAAVDALIAETIASDAKFLIVAGDIFDGDWRDVSTGLFFARQLGKLHLKGIPTFIAKGNHDAESVMSRALRYPDSVHVFDAARAETQLIETLGVALHGRSFAQRGAADDFVTTYPARREGWLNIGVLHTGLDGARGHNPYAPCTVDDLTRYGYDYWALGHIHAGEIVSRDPWVVYPGNLQGRSPRETGPKGAMRVSVEDSLVVGVDPIALDAARWAHETIDVSGLADASEAPARVAAALERAYRSAEGRPLAARVTLTGVTRAHARLVAHRELWEADARALGFAIGAECWLERLKIDTSPPSERAAAVEPDSLDVDALIAEAARDSEFVATLAELTRAVSEKLPAALRPEMNVDDPAMLAKLVALTREFLRGERQ
jgi:DNA repair exonuclease SbcCD nuclease subunit